MKKLVTILAISTIALTSIFAKTANVQLITNIEELQPNYVMKYDGVELNDEETKQIKVAPITKDGQTKDFTMHVTSNLNSKKKITVRVEPDFFKTKQNGSEEFNSRIKPNLKKNTQSCLSHVPAGKNDNLKVYSFYLNWKGNADLPAGDYTSNVKITYTVD